MTNEERRKKRYINRKNKRMLKKYSQSFKTFEEVFSIENLYEAGRKCCNGVRWKTSVINFEIFLFREVTITYNNLHNNTRKFPGFNSFKSMEHGKLRQINALPIRERMIQKCLCKNFLAQTYSLNFIYDNYASTKNRGMDFALKRLKHHLRKHYRKYGLNGGIYIFDFKNYFGSIPHDKIKERARILIKDNKLYNFFCTLINEFNQMKGGEKGYGLGLGSEISQIIALDYASHIDHYITDVCKKSYGRYMDDGYVISNSIEELKQIQKIIEKMTNERGLQINSKKNRIYTFKHHNFTFLKMRFSLKSSGKIVMKISRKTIIHMQRKLKKFEKMLKEDKIALKEIEASYKSWKSHAKKGDNKKSIYKMDMYFNKIFKQKGVF